MGPVVVAYDGSPTANEAVDAAVEAFREAPIVVLSVWRRLSGPAGVIGLPRGVAAKAVQQLEAEAEQAALETAEQGVARALQAGAEASAATVGADAAAWRAILDEAARLEARALACGRRGRSGASRALLGSVSGSLLSHSPVPVLVVGDSG